jgi:hypothetical protein
MPHVRNWIKTHGDAWLPKLIEDYKIEAVKATTGEELVSLKYNSIESPMHEPIVQECRGMIVKGFDQNAQIAAHPYNKFWNHGEHHAANIDWQTARVQAKLDGSLALLYDVLALGGPHDDKKVGWQFGSSGSPLGGGRYGSNDQKTFGETFWETFWGTGMKLPLLWRSLTFCFEFVAPDNRIVVKYNEPQLILHGARNRDTEEELSRKELEYVAKAFNWPIVKEYPLSSLDDVLTAVKALDPVDHNQGEGYVVVDGTFNRVKIKSPRYVALHHLRDKFTPRGVIHLWKAGEIDEVLVHFPEIKQLADSVVLKLEAACQNALDDFEKNKILPTRKDFAMAVKDRPWSGITFKLLSERDPSLQAARRILRESSDSLSEKLVEEVPNSSEEI